MLECEAGRAVTGVSVAVARLMLESICSVES